MNGFRKLQERLTQEGWFVGWGLPCCQSCAWAELPDDIDFEKVLFNHEQDCEIEIEEGDEDFFDRLEEDYGTGILQPEEQSSSYFCFSGNKKGVANLKAILPIIEECGCSIRWDGTGKTRPEISWEL